MTSILSGPLGKVDPVPASKQTWHKRFVVAQFPGGDLVAYGPVFNDETVAELEATIDQEGGTVIGPARVAHPDALLSRRADDKPAAPVAGEA